MGIVKTSFKVCNPRNEKCSLVEDAVVDTGSVLTWVPASLLKEIGLKPQETKTFITITGRHIKRGVSPARCEVNGGKAGCNVVFAEANDKTVLGATALETLGLDVDMTSRKLKRKQSFLAV